MANKFTNIKERILYIIENKGYTKEDFFNKIGMTYGNFKGSNKTRPLNSDSIVNILSIIPDINPTWLLTGKGNMLLDNEGPIEHKTEPKEDAQVGNSGIIDYLKAENEKLRLENKQLFAENAVLKHQNDNLMYQLKRNADNAQGVSMAG